MTLTEKEQAAFEAWYKEYTKHGGRFLMHEDIYVKDAWQARGAYDAAERDAYRKLLERVRSTMTTVYDHLKQEQTAASAVVALMVIEDIIAITAQLKGGK